MSLISAAELERHVKETESHMPVRFTWKSQQYTGQRGETLNSELMRESGFQQQYDFQLDVRKSEFGPARPAKRDEITIDGTTYRIQSISESQCGVMLRYDLAQQT